MSTKRRKDKQASWQTFASFPRPFSYEVDAPLKEVVQGLTELEQEARPFRRLSVQEISVLPAGDEYFFRVRRRQGMITVVSEGHVWQDDTGCVIVEGETRINGWSMLTPLVTIGILGVAFLPAFLRTPIPVIFPLVLFVIAMIAGSVLSVLTYTRDRKQLAAQLHDVMTSLQHDDASAKRKRHARLRLDEEAQEQASMWSEDPAPKQETRRS